MRLQPSHENDLKRSPDSQGDRPANDLRIARPKDPQRSRVANGSEHLPGVDGRSAWVRRCKELIADHIADLGGEANTSAAERSLIRRASVMTVELERLEVKFATAGEASPDDLELYQRTAGNLRRRGKRSFQPNQRRALSTTLTLRSRGMSSAN
jgi:hypothetical protein